MKEIIIPTLIFTISSISCCLYYAIRYKEVNLAVLLLSPIFGFFLLILLIGTLFEELENIKIWKGK